MDTLNSALRASSRVAHLLQRAALTSVLCVGCAGGQIGSQAPVASPSTPPESAVGAGSGATPLKILPHPTLSTLGAGANLADIAERVTPSVVNIGATKIGRKVEFDGLPGFSDPFFRHFFAPGDAPTKRNEFGLGSGVIVTDPAAGDAKLVLTNHHVIADADRIVVRTAGGQRLNATVIGSDAESDIAVLRLEGDTSKLVALPFGNSERIRLGDVVLAVGNPFGVGQTVTMGIVSAKGRSNMGIVDYEDFIQTDAAINPGNSGGALIDMEGNLIGINTAILARGGGNVGIGFAIPSSMAQRIVHSLLTDGEVRRGWLGVVIQELDAELAQALGVDATQGVVVSDMEKGGPGAKAGLRQGDVILSVDGKAVESTGALRNLVAATGAAKRVTLSVMRGKQPMTLNVTLGEAKSKGVDRTSVKAKAAALLGLKLDSLTPELRRRLGIPSAVPAGVLVTQVDAGSTAELSGIRRGDVVAEVDKRPVTSTEEFHAAINKRRSGPKALLLVYRGGRAMYLLLEVTKK